MGGWPLARVDLRAHFSLGRGLRPPRDPLGPAAFGYLSGSYSILLRSANSRLAAKARAEAEALAAEVSRRKKAEHQAKQITAAMEEAKKAAAKRR